MKRIPRRLFISTGAAGVASFMARRFLSEHGHSSVFARPLQAESPVRSTLDYLYERDPYYPGLHFPKLITPMWIGEKGVDAVVMLSFDDMGRKKAEGPTRLYPYHAQVDLHPGNYLQATRPVAERLRQIDGRSPITIFANEVEPQDPVHQQLLREGYSIDAHALTHPVPLMRTQHTGPVGDPSLELVIEDFVGSIANLNRIPNNRPVAFRTPGCDARNTVSPRFFSEVFPRLTPEGDFLQADSSVFAVFTSHDPSLPREWVLHDDGRERFVKYLHGMPSCKFYANCIFDYPYPYVIDHRIWELPPLMPADSNGLHLHQAHSPATVEDWKRALDLVVHKQGIMVLCLHPETPHSYIRGDMVAEVVDYADHQYGRRVKFLTAREICDRLTENLLDGEPLRSGSGADNGVRLIDVNGDGYLDVVIGNSRIRRTKIWQPEEKSWRSTSLPASIVSGENQKRSVSSGAHFFTASPSGEAGLTIATPEGATVWRFDGRDWVSAGWKLPESVDGQPLYTARDGIDRGVRFRDLDGNGYSDLILNNESQNAVFLWRPEQEKWEQADFRLPAKSAIVDAHGVDQGLRFVDLTGNGSPDVVFSNEKECWVYLFEGLPRGWSRLLLKGKSGEIPPIVYNGAINGVWFHSGALIHANEFTEKGDSGWISWISFEDLLKTGQG